MHIDIDALNEAIKYSLFNHEDALHHMAATDNLDVHGAYGDYLQENGNPDEHELGKRLVSEWQRQTNGEVPPPEAPEGDYSFVDHTLNSLARSHKKPYVRLLAKKELEEGDAGHAHRAKLLDFLLSHNPDLDPAAHDIAVLLSHEDHKVHPAAHAIVRHINNSYRTNPFNQAGLDVKVVDGVAHLRDHDNLLPDSHNSPHILFHAGANDPDEMHALLAHANEVVAQKRHAQETAGHVIAGGAHMAPATFGS